MLSNLLAQDGGILSDRWFYSTELRVLNTQLIFSLLFRITNNWMLVRLLGTVIMWCLLLLCVFYFCKTMGISKYFPILGILLLIPYSEQYFLYVLMGTYYIPHIAIGFLTLGLTFQTYDEHRTKVKVLLVITNSILALIAGMGGIRELFILYLPLFIASIILFVMEFFRKKAIPQKSIFSLSLSCLLLLSSSGGYIINHIYLNHKYSFQNFDSVKYQYFNFDKLQDLINGFLYFHGYRKERSLFSLYTLCNVTCVIILFLLVIGILWYKKHWDNLSNKIKLLSVFYAVSVLMLIALYIMTDMNYLHRYWILSLIWELPLIIIWYKESTCIIKSHVIAYIIGLLCLCSTIIYHGYIKFEQNFLEFYPNNIVREDIITCLIENEYYQGYASFWNANVMTELSNGKIEVWSLPDALNDTNIYPWLQEKDHAFTQPDQRHFYLFSESCLTNMALLYMYQIDLGCFYYRIYTKYTRNYCN